MDDPPPGEGHVTVNLLVPRPEPIVVPTPVALPALPAEIPPVALPADIPTVVVRRQ